MGNRAVKRQVLPEGLESVGPGKVPDHRPTVPGNDALPGASRKSGQHAAGEGGRGNLGSLG
eukprot:2299842-Alexandrium_andersonii.AAC.1